MIVKFKLNNESTSYVNIPSTLYSNFIMALHKCERGDAPAVWVIRIEVGMSRRSSDPIGYFSTIEDAQRVLDEIAKYLVSDNTPWFDVDLFLSKGFPFTGVKIDLPPIPPII